LSRATIGAYPDISLGQAREQANELRRVVASGQNPIDIKRQRRADAGAKTFAALAERYLTEHSRRFKRSSGEDERNLRLHVLPLWQARRYDEIRRADVIELIERLVAADKPVLANRVHALISGIYSFAVDADLVGSHPCSRLKKRGVERIGRRVLSDDEIRLFWPTTIHPPVSRRVGLALRLILLTGVRAGEVAGLRLHELSRLDQPQAAAWILPAERVKNGRPHLVPLSEPACETIREATALLKGRGEFLFPSPARDVPGPISAHALAVAMRRYAGRLTGSNEAVTTWQAEPPSPHDLRRTVATRLSGLGIPKEDRDAVLNHARTDVGSKHYDLYDREREKRRALNTWATALALILNPRTAVVPMHHAAR
jgi:integrase